MAVSETHQSQVCSEAKDLQSDPGQGGVGRKERTSAVVMYIAGDPALIPDWNSLDSLTPGCDSIDYINYKQVIEKERLPIATTSPVTDVYAGVLYAKLAGGDRCVYFEPQPDPDRSVMRVAENVAGNDTVKTSYPWDRVNFVYKVAEEREVGEGTYKCYIYTPANLESYGLVVKGENVHFEPTPGHRPKPNFTTVHMKQKTKDSSGDDKTDLGLYVDKEDGWKVKVTNKPELWTTFSIRPFTPQAPPENAKQPRRTSLCTYDLLC